jgi:uncharacterized phiE125 gp8 family phage protein
MLLPVRTSAPAETPITLAEAKAHCRVNHSDEDSFITSLISAATEYFDGIDGVLGRALVTQSWRQDYNGFDDVIRLPLSPVASITSVTYYDADNTQQTLANTVYELKTDSDGPYLALKIDQSWPSVYNREPSVSVTFVAGTATASVPNRIKNAIKLLVGHWYDNRSAATEKPMSDIPFGVTVLVGNYRRVNL